MVKILYLPTRWAPTSYKWSYGPLINGLIIGFAWGDFTPISGLITILITGRGAHLVGSVDVYGKSR